MPPNPININHAGPDIELDTRASFIMAQRAGISARLRLSAELGTLQYWKGLVSSTDFSGANLRACLNTIHTEITSSWGSNDPDNLLESEEFRGKIMALVRPVILEPSDMSSWCSQSLETIQGFTGIASAFSPVFASVAAAVGLSSMCIAWIDKVYRTTPEVLRCLMTYTVDLTLVMNRLSLDTLALQPLRPLSVGQIDVAIEYYRQRTAQEVHSQIRDFTNSTFRHILHRYDVKKKIVDLIEQYRMDNMEDPTD